MLIVSVCFEHSILLSEIFVSLCRGLFSILRAFVLIAFSHPSSGGCNIEGEDESWDFGTGAGFYVNATQDPWKTNYRMYAYVTEEV